ncbi:MAG: hypothetical protein ABIO89_01445 [Cryobacterium sp.]
MSAVVALGWIAMATTHPTVTYHFAPIVAVIAAPLFTRFRTDQPLPPRRSLVLSAIGVLIVAIATAVIASLDAFRGPTLIGPGSALTETLMAIAAGSMIGLTAMIARRTPK